jgi:hypothetical protein
MKKVFLPIALGLVVFLLMASIPTGTNAPTDASGYRMPNMVDRVQKLSEVRDKPPSPVTVSFSDPTDGQTIDSYGIYTVKVDADSPNGIKKVTLAVDGVTYDITNNYVGGYYCYDWNIQADGDYTLEAKATDNRNKRGSAEITVHVVTGTPPPGKWAVVIGIADYTGRDSDLWNPDSDASEMKSILLENGYPDSQIKFLTNRKATATAILDAIDWLIANEGPNDQVFFFFSGHGYRAPDNENWDDDSESDGYDEGLVTYDFYGLPDGMLADRFVQLESTDIGMCFCQCHSGGMFDDNDDAGITGTGRVLVSACKADQYGWDYKLLRNTLFFYYWGDQGLLLDNADSVESAYSYAYPFVVAEQPDSQPQLWDNYPGDFSL